MSCCSSCHRSNCCCPRKKKRKPVPPTPPPSVTVDYVLVGAGTAGAPLAKLLTDDLVTSVTILEAGENRGNDPVIRGMAFPVPPPIVEIPLFWDPRYSYSRYVVPTAINPGTFGQFFVSDGRLWGGSSAHNYQFAAFGSPRAYDEWGLVHPRWNFNNLLPLRKALETYTPNGTAINPAVRGTSGPLFITQRPPFNPANISFYTVIGAAMNAPFVPDYNDPTFGEVSISQVQQFANPALTLRSSSQTAFLTPDVITEDGHGVGGRKLEIISRATAVQIIFDTAQSPPVARGVRYFLGDNQAEVVEIFARKKVILCAGTIATAKIMQLSGVGPASVLANAGVPVVVANENVGRNVQTHGHGPTVLIPQNPNDPTVPEAAMIFIDISGPNIAAPSDGVARCEIITASNQYRMPTQMVLRALGLENVPLISFTTFLLDSPRSGTIEIFSEDPNAEPMMRYHFYEDVAPPGERNSRQLAADVYKAVANASLAYSGQMPLYPPAFQYPVSYPGGTQPDDTRLQDIAKDDPFVYRAIDHHCGSCRMATSAADGVVDANLDVFGVRNLAICDNSVIPQINGGHTAWPAFLLGMRKAQIEGVVIPGVPFL